MAASSKRKQRQATPGEPLSLRVRTAQTGARRHALGLIFNRDWRHVSVTRGGSAHRELLANAGLVVEEIEQDVANAPAPATPNAAQDESAS